MPRPAGGSTAPSRLDPYMGDAWAVHYAFELQQGTDVERTDVLGRCVAADPSHGELWKSISKTNTTEKQRFDKASILRKVVAAYFSGNGVVVVIPRGPTSTG
ncbi:pre-mRNA splicing factor, putative [Ectocarpus siliculosus]|uniref:Pre-mRNA splicing factor, putative n=1 Tax=Ectocarpus siliculosus TaxID=2880 RepID=D8LE81_ECTSI|nr:pre-mRNA splicing factor, putative [Ectocarpus siliculosus]|eukprot:CBN74157.1 pre-mRNA splicing factor, putative [Ectocarpus siliculosus]